MAVAAAGDLEVEADAIGAVRGLISNFNSWQANPGLFRASKMGEMKGGMNSKILFVW